MKSKLRVRIFFLCQGLKMVEWVEFFLSAQDVWLKYFHSNDNPFIGSAAWFSTFDLFSGSLWRLLLILSYCTYRILRYICVANVCFHIYIYTYVCVCVCVHVVLVLRLFMYLYICAYIYVCVCVCIHIYRTCQSGIFVLHLTQYCIGVWPQNGRLLLQTGCTSRK